MPDSATLYLLLLIAIALGYALGRAERRRKADKGEQKAMQTYYRGLDFVLREPSDLAVERFIESMPVEEATVDTHLALGAVLRHRGEADKAVRIHQNLIAQAQLSGLARSRAEYELARDYFSAGLFGRAESLLTELIAGDAEWQPAAQSLLVDIYQRERDWSSAIELGRRLDRRDPGVRRRLAHFHCELAEQALDAGELSRARQVLAAGVSEDPRCARLYLLSARLEEQLDRPKAVRRQVSKALAQDPTLAVDSADRFARACRALNDRTAWLKYLAEALGHDTESLLLGRLVEALAEDNPQQALQAVLDQVDSSPSLSGLGLLLERWQTQPEDAQSRLDALQSLLARVPSEAKGYRCSECGFSAQARLWQCPTCSAWDTAYPVGRAGAPER